MSEGHERPKGDGIVQQCIKRWPLFVIVVSAACMIANVGWLLEIRHATQLRLENIDLRQANAVLKSRVDKVSAENNRLRFPPLTEAQLAQQAIDKEIAWQSWHMPAEIESELIDQPTLAPVGASAGQQFADPHDDPEWHHTRREFANEHCCCMVRGCTDDPKGDAIHHGIAANACIKAGHYELAVKAGHGQQFYRLCEKHHAEIGHGIGHGGSWTKFNLDIDADVKAGRWNSRGKSEWKFMSEAELISWVKERTDAAKALSKTTQAP